MQGVFLTSSTLHFPKGGICHSQIERGTAAEQILILELPSAVTVFHILDHVVTCENLSLTGT